MIHPTAIIGPNVEVEEGAFIGPLCVIGQPAEHPRQVTTATGKVVIRKGARLTKLVTVDSPLDKSGITYIGPNCYLMAHSHVGHDATLSEHVTLACGAKIGGHAKVEARSNIGLNAVVHQHSVVPTGTMLAASAFYKGTDGGTFQVWAGVPARPIKENTVLMDRLEDEGLSAKDYE